MKSDDYLLRSQNAFSALDILHEANKKNIAINVSASGDIEAAYPKDKPGRLNTILIYLKNFFGLQNAQERAEKSAAAAVILNKMKIEVHLLISERISQIHNINEYKNRNALESREAAWPDDVRKTMTMALEGVRKNLVEIEKSIKKGKFKEAENKWSELRESVKKKSEDQSRDFRRLMFSTTTDKPVEVLVRLKARDQSTKKSERSQQTSEKSPPPAKASASLVIALNKALPSCISNYSGSPIETVEGRAMLSTAEIKTQFEALSSSPMSNIHLLPNDDDMTEIDLNEGSPHIALDDKEVEICDQFLRDTTRSQYVFQGLDGRTAEFPLGSASAAVAREFALVCGGTGENFKMLSKIINQNAIGILYVATMKNIKGRSGQELNFEMSPKFEPRIKDTTQKGGDRSPHLSRCSYTVKRVGQDFEVDILYMQKIHTLNINERDGVAINRGSIWEGDVNAQNWGLQMSAKISLKQKDLERGDLSKMNFLVPPSVAFRIAPCPGETINP